MGTTNLIEVDDSGIVTASSTSSTKISVRKNSGLGIENQDGIKGSPTLFGIDATTTVKGIVQLANSANVKKNSSTTALTPDSLQYHPSIAKAWIVINIAEKVEVVESYRCKLVIPTKESREDQNSRGNRNYRDRDSNVDARAMYGIKFTTPLAEEEIKTTANFCTLTSLHKRWIKTTCECFIEEDVKILEHENVFWIYINEDGRAFRADKSKKIRLQFLAFG